MKIWAFFASSACGPCLLALVLLRVPAWLLPCAFHWTSYLCSPAGLCATLAAVANARDVISIYLSPGMSWQRGVIPCLPLSPAPQHLFCFFPTAAPPRARLRPHHSLSITASPAPPPVSRRTPPPPRRPLLQRRGRAPRAGALPCHGRRRLETSGVGMAARVPRP